MSREQTWRTGAGGWTAHSGQAGRQVGSRQGQVQADTACMREGASPGEGSRGGRGYATVNMKRFLVEGGMGEPSERLMAQPRPAPDPHLVGPSALLFPVLSSVSPVQGQGPQVRLQAGCMGIRMQSAWPPPPSPVSAAVPPGPGAHAYDWDSDVRLAQPHLVLGRDPGGDAGHLHICGANGRPPGSGNTPRRGCVS